MVRAFAVHALPFIALVVVGALVLALAGDRTAWRAVGFAMIGLGSVLCVSVFFHEVGRSEDRDRADRRGGRGS